MRFTFCHVGSSKSLWLQGWLLQLHTQGTVKSTGDVLHMKLKCIEKLYFATLLFQVTVYENGTLCIQIGPYKNGVVGMLTLRAAAQQHGSENLQSRQSSF